MHFPVGSDQWRNWQNTELLVESHGLRLDEQPFEIRDAVMAVVRASLASEGFEMSRDVMRLNGFLGEVIGLPLVLGDGAISFACSATRPTTHRGAGSFSGIISA